MSDQSEEPPAEGLTEVLARRFLTTDAARPDKVAGWHAKGRRTARENIADLIDDGSFVEYGRFVTPAQEGRRDALDLVLEGPADGIIGGIVLQVGNMVLDASIRSRLEKLRKTVATAA